MLAAYEPARQRYLAILSGSSRPAPHQPKSSAGNTKAQPRSPAIFYAVCVLTHAPAHWPCAAIAAMGASDDTPHADAHGGAAARLYFRTPAMPIDIFYFS